MPPLRMRYLSMDKDRRGNARWYVRVPGMAKVRIRAALNADGTASKAFMDEYFAAIKGEPLNARPKVKTVDPTTIQGAIERYFASPKFARYDAATQRDKRSVLGRYADAAGTIPLKALRREDVARSQQKRAATPGAADKLVKYLRAFFKWAIDEGMATTNPAAGIPKLNTGSTGWHTWTLAEVEQFEARHPIGTPARLALALLIHTGGRRADVCALGRQHETADGLSWIADKGRDRKPTRIDIPMTTELRTIIDASPVGDLTYLVGGYGAPYTVAGFGNRFRDWCDEAGLAHCSAHGLRKAAAVRLAEAGASAMELCAVFGWSKLETAETYVRMAQKKRMAANAFGKIVPLSGAARNGGAKGAKSDAKTKSRK